MDRSSSDEPVFPLPDELQGRRSEVFPVLTPSQLVRITAAGAEQRFEDGDVLYDQGDVGVPMFVVLEGEIEVVHPERHAERAVVVLRANEFTGEANLLRDGRALVRARARGPVRALRIEHARLRTLLHTDSELSDVLLRAFIFRRIGLFAANVGDAIIIGSRHSADTARLQSFLVQNAHPHKYIDVERDADVQTLLDEFRIDVADVPVLICRGARVLRNPTNAEAAECLGFNPSRDTDVVYDVVICGAGPGGLAAAVYAASEGMNVLVVEAQSPGGQAAGSSKIENYLGFPTGISGASLMARALAQAEKFGANVAVATSAMRIDGEYGTYRIELSGGESVRARTIIIATGASYRKLDVAGRERFEGVGIYYAATELEARRCDDDDVVVVGAANSAGQAATFLARSSRKVHLLVRGGGLAAHMSRYLIRRIEEMPNIVLHPRTQVVGLDGNDHLERIVWRDDVSGAASTYDIRHLFSMAGADPHTDWLRGVVATDAKGFVLTGFDLSDEQLSAARWPRQRRPYLFETSRPGIFAVGDVRASRIKRIASSVGEGSICIQLVRQALDE